MKTPHNAIAVCVLLGSLATVAAGCGGQPSTQGPTANPIATKSSLDGANPDICSVFSADFVYTAIGKPIVKIEPSPLASVFSCAYYTEYSETYFKDKPSGKAYPGGRNIHITLERTIGKERQKGNLQTVGLTLDTDQRINYDHTIAKRKDGSVWGIFLFLDDRQFLDVNMLQKPLASDDELISFAAKVADLLNGKGAMDIKTNPVSLTTDKQPEAAALNQTDTKIPKQQVNDFLSAIGSGKIDGALDMMDANRDTKQAWGVNFNSLESLTVTKLEPAFQEEWTATRQTYKAELQVKLKSGNEAFGWTNGRNLRWITIQKSGGKWLVHELSNNP